MNQGLCLNNCAGLYEENGDWYPYPLDNQTTITCPWDARGCVLEIEQTAEVGTEAYSGDEWSLEVLLDGGWLYSPIEGYMTFYSYGVGTYDQSVPIGPGKHCVQSFVAVEDGEYYLLSYHVNYRVYVKQ
jgi:hypothetical protein